MAETFLEGDHYPKTCNERLRNVERDVAKTRHRALGEELESSAIQRIKEHHLTLHAKFNTYSGE